MKTQTGLFKAFTSFGNYVKRTLKAIHRFNIKMLEWAIKKELFINDDEKIKMNNEYRYGKFLKKSQREKHKEFLWGQQVIEYMYAGVKFIGVMLFITWLEIVPLFILMLFMTCVLKNLYYPLVKCVVTTWPL